MSQKRSIGLTILGWVEIVVGFLGTGFCLLCFLYFIAYARAMGGNFLLISAVFLPPALIFLSLSFLGTGILKLKRWAWKSNVILYPLGHIYIWRIILVGTGNENSHICTYCE